MQPKQHFLLGGLGILGVIGMLFLGFRSTRNANFHKQTVEGLIALEEACSLYFDRYDSLPLSEGTDGDTTVTTDDSETGIITAVLFHPDAPEISPYLTKFLEFREAKNGKNGILKTAQGYSMIDPWGNPYFIRLDHDYNQSITDPGTPETSKDDISSWK